MTQHPNSNRRAFIKQVTLCAAATPFTLVAAAGRERTVQTVLGPVKSSILGVTLPHEHVMCDFIGAKETGTHRWEVSAVVQRMSPYLKELKSRGVAGFVDCTPAYIGRDARVLKILSEESGLHILTNTGYYGGAGDKFVPQHAYQETADQLANRWIDEWEKGIEGTGVKPGFIKIGIDEVNNNTGALSAIDEKLVRAAARASQQTNLSVVCHTGGGPAGLAATRIFSAEKAIPTRFIVAHSDKHGLETNRAVADLGAWVSFDAISRQPLNEHLTLVTEMVQKHAERLLLSQDNGWYWVGQANGGEIRDFNYISDTFLPACRQRGISERILHQLTVTNPARAFEH